MSDDATSKTIKGGEHGGRNKPGFTFLDILAIFARRFKLIVIMSVIGCSAILLFVLVTKLMPVDWSLNIMPDYFEPEVRINLQEPRGSLLSSISGSGNLASLISRGGLAVANPNIELTQVLLEGNTIKDKIIDEFGFIKKYHISDLDIYKARENARILFSKQLNVGLSDNPTSALFSMSYRDVDSDFATKVLNRIIELVEARFRELTTHQVAIRREFIEERLRSTEAELKAAEGRLVAFNTAHGVVDISSQAKELSAVIADMSADLLKKEIELKTLLGYSDEGSSRVVYLRNEIAKRKQLIDDLKKGLPGSSLGVIPQNKMYSLTNEYLEIKAAIDLQTRIYGMLKEQLEIAKIDENDNSQIFQIVEPAEFLKVKTGPLRVRMTLTAWIAVIIASIVFAFVYDYFKRILENNPAESRKWEEIKRSILPGKRNKRR